MTQVKDVLPKYTVHGRMAVIKDKLSHEKVPKSGHNKFAGFKYHELGDFMPYINKYNLENGVNDFANIDEVNNVCTLTLTNVDDANDFYVVSVPFREAEMLSKGGGASNVDVIQRMGSTITYNRRYLYMTAYNIQESDGVDGLEPTEKVTPQKAQPAQQQSNNDVAKSILNASKTLIELQANWSRLTTEQQSQIEVVALKDKLKTQLK